ncbi:MAG: GGDEF domain-containing protein [Levilactobacillus sp.]|jgi:GGDEF domain-containing protein|uniref:GGDEF domain-containing protein n=1 Tax=Levilactobacillus sp. TaxID=2767919 RepID=UPI00258CA4E7|nr:GGDEF domain-containing protein [Levilactobacillus sp.]MCI1554434.1 GGDEF domain-containing protein [Levilactobacillus sp.]MCI1598235.1 GGDEF domain-containing protein [Levilactobacillus sp.]MCI1605916.1 GGDEF domain-containing protein [Levilactobacillus sp.]
MTNRAKNSNRETWLTDIYLIAFLMMVSGLALGIAATQTHYLLINVTFLAVTICLILFTYFWGIITGLLLNLAFMFAQILIVIYVSQTHADTVAWGLLFWMILPLLLSISFYGMTAHLRKLQADNVKLRQDLIERGAFDESTNLRTTVSFIEDTAVFTETNRRFNLPVTTMIIRIRYFQEMRSMISDSQLSELLQLVSETIKDAMRTNDITYLLDRTNPTWGVLLFTNADGAGIAGKRIKDKFDKALLDSDNLATLEVRLMVGVASWDAEKMKNPYDLMNAGIKETEYDV